MYTWTLFPLAGLGQLVPFSLLHRLGEMSLSSKRTTYRENRSEGFPAPQICFPHLCGLPTSRGAGVPSPSLQSSDSKPRPQAWRRAQAPQEPRDCISKGKRLGVEARGGELRGLRLAD